MQCVQRNTPYSEQGDNDTPQAVHRRAAGMQAQHVAGDGRSASSCGFDGPQPPAQLWHCQHQGFGIAVLCRQGSHLREHNSSQIEVLRYLPIARETLRTPCRS